MFSVSYLFHNLLPRYTYLDLIWANYGTYGSVLAAAKV